METEWRIYAAVRQSALVQIMACRLVGAIPIIWTNAEIFLIAPLVTNFSENLTEIDTLSFNKYIWKCRPEITAILSRP